MKEVLIQKLLVLKCWPFVDVHLKKELSVDQVKGSIFKKIIALFILDSYATVSTSAVQSFRIQSFGLFVLNLKR